MTISGVNNCSKIHICKYKRIYFLTVFNILIIKNMINVKMYVKFVKSRIFYHCQIRILKQS